jgi:serine/threonine-protein kinase
LPNSQGLLGRLLGRHKTPSIERLPPHALPAGTRLDSLRIERAVARGGSSVLYLATDEGNGQTCAVKVFCPLSGTGDDEAAAQRSRFLQEAQRASQLDHPHIVRIHACGLVSGIAYLSMPHLPGAALSRWCGSARRLPEPAALETAAQLAEALGHAHRRGIVHRDVKPSNVIFDPERRMATLTDFGLARAPDADASRSGVMAGSPVYMAPELLAGASADAASDLYALGVLTYELLAGRPPFEAASMGALLRAVARETPPSLANVRPDWPAAVARRLDTCVATWLAKDPRQRSGDGDAWAAQARAVSAELAPCWNSAANATLPG